jgi:Aspartyl protease
MPHLTLPVQPHGLAAELVVGLDGDKMTSLTLAGLPIPPPVRITGLIDTATDLTALSPQLIQRLALPVLGTVATLTASGPAHVRLYEVSLSITGPVAAAGPIYVLSKLRVTELATAIPNADCLLGMDVLGQGLFILDGPAKRFTIGF